MKYSVNCSISFFGMILLPFSYCNMIFHELDMISWLYCLTTLHYVYMEKNTGETGLGGEQPWQELSPGE